MYSTKQFRTGIVAALVALAPALASAQGGTAQSTQQSGTTQQQGQGGGGGDQAAVRQHLGEARTALAELTKLPAAAQLQGAQRDAVAKLISDFNAFATATSDWRSKYQLVDESLNKLLEQNGSGAAPSATPPSGTPPSTTAPEGAPAADAPLDPTILEKLKEVRTALDNFEQASGDPVFMVEGIEKVLEEASTGSGSVTLNQTQLDQIRSYLDKIRKAATR